MGRGIKLTSVQRSELEQLRKETPSADVFRNCSILLLSDLGETIPAIARSLGCGTDTVNRVRRLYRKGGVTALHPIKPPGRTPRATSAFIEQMKQAAQTSPLTLGYGFSTWSAVRLAEHLAKVTGIRYGDDRLRALLHQHGFSFHRPKHTMKGKRDESAYQKAGKQLVRLKKKP
jgi:transposase